MKKKNIYFTVENLQEVQSIIDTAEKRTRVRKSSAEDILEILNEKMIDYNLSFLPKKALKGMKVTIQQYCCRFPSLYHGTPESTVVELSHNGKNWVLESVYRDSCNKSERNQFLITFFPDEAKMLLIDRMCKGTLYK